MATALDDLFPAYLRSPPLMRDVFAQRYIGQRVCWRLSFATTHEMGGQLVLVGATQRRLRHRFPSSAFFTLDPSRFPDLHTARKGRRLMVCGTIERFTSNGVRLQLETLDVLPPSIFDRIRY